MRFFNPSPGFGLTGALVQNFSTRRGTTAKRDVAGADGAIAVRISAKSTGSYAGRKGNSVFNVLQRVNATPRYVLQFFDPRGTQIGSTIVENGTSLAGLATTLASNANGTHFTMTVFNNTNQATQDTGNGFANSTQLKGGG